MSLADTSALVKTLGKKILNFVISYPKISSHASIFFLIVSTHSSETLFPLQNWFISRQKRKRNLNQLYTAVAEMKYILQNDGEGCGKSTQMTDRCITFNVTFCCSVITFLSKTLSADGKLQNLEMY